MLGVLSKQDGTPIDANITTLEHEKTTTTTTNTNTTFEHETTTTTNTNTTLEHELTTTTNTNTALKHDTAYAYDSNATDTTMNEKDMVLDGVAAMHVNNTENTDIDISLDIAGGVLDCPGASMGAQITETDQPYTDTTIVTSTIPSGNFDAPSISSLGLKILAKKEVHDYDSFQSKYDPSNNKSVNVLTIYEKTNVIGIRMEQLAMGGQSYLEPSILQCLNNVKDIAMKEFEQRKIPFIICRKFFDNIKEYWKLNDLIY
jgi:DNA-directed RNA polymerase subunit K/omega